MGMVSTISFPDFRLLFESAPGLYLVLSPTLEIVAVSDAYLQATMTQRQAILGKRLFDVFPDNPNDPDASGTANLRASLNRVISECTPDTMAVQKYDIRRPDFIGGGFEERFWSPVNTPVCDACGKLLYIIHRVEDITDFIRLKQKDQEQQQTNSELRLKAGQNEIEVYLRAQEVAAANRSLQRANLELERLYDKMKELDQFKTSFFASVSHELRTPLTLILAPVEKLLLNPGLDEAGRRTLRVIERNARLLLKQVNELLDIAKLEAGKVSLNLARQDLAIITRVVASHFDGLAEERHIRYLVEADDKAMAYVDVEKIQRILLNLLANAFKFTGSCGVVHCSLRPDYQQCRVVITVADSGAGIAPPLRDLVFEPYRQVETPPGQQSNGTGLGLAIAREFAELHGGTLTVGEAQEGGALFTLVLPILAPEVVSETSRDEPLPDSRADVANILAGLAAADNAEELSDSPDGARVLVVEDNAEMRSFITACLASCYRIRQAANGEDALKVALAWLPDLVVPDVAMPKMAGDQLVLALRRHDELAHTPILLLSARTDQEFRVLQLESGAQDYLIKPFSVAELQARVRNLVNAKLAEDNNRKLSADLQQRHLHLQRLTTDLADANKELESFSYSVSHDLRSPLRAVDGFSRLLLERAADRLDAEDKRLLGVVRASSAMMGQLIDDLLHFSRVSRGELRVASTDMSRLVHEVWPEVNEGFTGRIIIDDLPPALIDRSLLRQVWINLLSNAVKYSSHNNNALITVTGESLGGESLYHVADNGAGFDMCFVDKLFGVFQRLHSAEEFAGTGVGLAIVARIISRHGGRVWAEGEVGRGAKFHFAIPA